MNRWTSFRNLLLIWLGWSLIMIAYQYYVSARFTVVRPDYAVSWTPGETRSDSQEGKPYLTTPFLNEHVAWDSEYYLSIAVGGYKDPVMRALPPDYSWRHNAVGTNAENPLWISQNYAFFPLYPYLMRIVAFPFGWLGLSPIAAATLAGVIISLLGALAAMLSIRHLVLQRKPEKPSEVSL